MDHILPGFPKKNKKNSEEYESWKKKKDPQGFQEFTPHQAKPGISSAVRLSKAPKRACSASGNPRISLGKKGSFPHGKNQRK